MNTELNEDLVYLVINGNKFSELKTGNNPNLRVLHCMNDKSFGSLPNLDISGCSNLVEAFTEGDIENTESGGFIYYIESEDEDAYQMHMVDSVYYYLRYGLYIDPATRIYAGGDVPQTRWRQVKNGDWYYYDDGILQTSWKKIGNQWFFFGWNGIMQTGWQNVYTPTDDGYTSDWYYFNSNGVMQTGWKKSGGKWYFLKSDGAMAYSEWCQGYWLNKNGTWTYKPKGSWKKDSTGWWFGDTSGWYAKKEWQKIDNDWYYFDSKGYMVTGTRVINGKTYQFDSNGVCLNP